MIEGLKALAEGGIDSVKVERLAVRLQVSKAPFYWRFKDRAALLEAMLDYWKNELTRDLIAKVSSLETPRDRLDALMRLALEEQSAGLQVTGVEGAIRAWAAQDMDVGKFVAEVDELRVAYLAKELRSLGAQARSANDLSKGIYLALIGLYAVRRYTPSLASDAAYGAIVQAALDGIPAQRTT